MSQAVEELAGFKKLLREHVFDQLANFIPHGFDGFGDRVRQFRLRARVRSRPEASLYQLVGASGEVWMILQDERSLSGELLVAR